MMGFAILIVIVSVISAITWAVYYNKRKSQDITGEQITKTNKELCVILTVLLPCAFFSISLFMPNGCPSPTSWILAYVVVEVIGVVSAFRLVRLARTPVWIVGMIAFPLHMLLLGLVLLTVVEAPRL